MIFLMAIDWIVAAAISTYYRQCWNEDLKSLSRPPPPSLPTKEEDMIENVAGF